MLKKSNLLLNMIILARGAFESDGLWALNNSEEVYDPLFFRAAQFAKTYDHIEEQNALHIAFL